MEDLQQLQGRQWYVVKELNKCIKDLMQICKGLKETTQGMAVLVQLKEISGENLDKTIATLNFLTTRVQDDVSKLVGFMQHVIMMFDTVMEAMHQNIAVEHSAVEEMIKKILEPCSYSLSEGTKTLIKRKWKNEVPQKHGGVWKRNRPKIYLFVMIYVKVLHSIRTFSCGAC